MASSSAVGTLVVGAFTAPPAVGTFLPFSYKFSIIICYYFECCGVLELSWISFNEYYPMKFQFLKVILVLFEFYFYIM